MDQELVLKVTGVKVEFDNHKILDDISFQVKRDETLAVVGPNGAGKTVLFRALLGLIPFEGKVEWANDVRIGYVPQKLFVDHDLPLTVQEFLELKQKSKSKIIEVLSKVGIKEKAEHVHHDVRVLKSRLGTLSGGELQRILMAYALLNNPNVLLLDEPTAGVDIKGEETFYDLFKKLKMDKDLTIVFITHDKEIVERYADSVFKLNHTHN